MTREELDAEKNAFTESFMAEVLSAIQGAYLVALEDGLTVEDAAKAMEITPQEFEDIIWGRAELSLRTLGELSVALDCDIKLDIVPTDVVNKQIFSNN